MEIKTVKFFDRMELQVDGPEVKMFSYQIDAGHLLFYSDKSFKVYEECFAEAMNTVNSLLKVNYQAA